MGRRGKRTIPPLLRGVGGRSILGEPQRRRRGAALAGTMAAIVAVMAAAMEATDVEAVGRAKVRWVRDEAAVALAEVIVAAAVEAMKARMSGVQR